MDNIKEKLELLAFGKYNKNVIISQSVNFRAVWERL